jgi:hypothetical protein
LRKGNGRGGGLNDTSRLCKYQCLNDQIGDRLFSRTSHCGHIDLCHSECSA